MLWGYVCAYVHVPPPRIPESKDAQVPIVNGPISMGFVSSYLTNCRWKPMDTRGQLYIVFCKDIAKEKQELILTNQRPFPHPSLHGVSPHGSHKISG